MNSASVHVPDVVVASAATQYPTTKLSLFRPALLPEFIHAEGNVGFALLVVRIAHITSKSPAMWAGIVIEFDSADADDDNDIVTTHPAMQQEPQQSPRQD